MGLDICFNKGKAVAAGLKLERVRRGTDAEIAEAKAEFPDDGYINYLEAEVLIVDVPLPISMMFMQPIKVEAVELDNELHVRANTWGRVHAPLTKFLKENDIEWGEY